MYASHREAVNLACLLALVVDRQLSSAWLYVTALRRAGSLLPRPPQRGVMQLLHGEEQCKY